MLRKAENDEQRENYEAAYKRMLIAHTKWKLIEKDVESTRESMWQTYREWCDAYVGKGGIVPLHMMRKLYEAARRKYVATKVECSYAEDDFRAAKSEFKRLKNIVTTNAA